LKQLIGIVNHKSHRPTLIAVESDISEFFSIVIRGGEFPNEGVGKFIAGLAGNIGLDAERAATIVVAAVAARTRATFLQAWVSNLASPIVCP